jgi:succinate dehydrogenase / fumarate reductase, iron-sulfur subunit
MTPGKALLHPHKAPKEVKRIFEQVEGRGERYELNLYVVGVEEDEEALADNEAALASAEGPDAVGGEEHAAAAGSHLPEERSPNA